jgi:membrane protease YdiL (CAAX protease family)
VLEILELFVTQPMIIRLTGKQPDLSDFQVLIGNFKILLFGLVLAWVLAGLGEELVYRGYLMNRVADLIENRRIAWGASLVLVSVLFGFAHLYQGRTGVLDEGLMGLLLGALYLGCGRSLAVPIIAHGVQDTVDLLLIYLGKYPGMG